MICKGESVYKESHHNKLNQNMDPEPIDLSVTFHSLVEVTEKCSISEISQKHFSKYQAQPNHNSCGYINVIDENLESIKESKKSKRVIVLRAVCTFLATNR